MWSAATANVVSDAAADANFNNDATKTDVTIVGVGRATRRSTLLWRFQEEQTVHKVVSRTRLASGCYNC